MGHLPPACGWYPSYGRAASSGWGTLFFHLLPFIEQNKLYKSAQVTGPNPLGQDPGPNQTSYSGAAGGGAPGSLDTYVISTYVCPSDPSSQGNSYNDTIYGLQWATSSYAGNFQVFGRSIIDAQVSFGAYQGSARIPANIPDGTSNTMLFAEKYARCESTQYNKKRACLWDWWKLSPLTGNAYSPVFAFPFNDLPNGVGPQSRFQLQPNPFVGNCDPARAATAHTGGIQVGLADASVRNVSPAVSRGRPYRWPSCNIPTSCKFLNSANTRATPLSCSNMLGVATWPRNSTIPV